MALILRSKCGCFINKYNHLIKFLIYFQYKTLKVLVKLNQMI